MENKRPLLSICIPTYNRADYLRGALDNIISDPSFDERVEIVISDNASTDNTPIICEQYIAEYSNIHYYRNESNVKDENFILALNRGNGKYVKLCNDTLRFQKGVLTRLLKIISVSSEDIPLFFYQNISFLGNVNIAKQTEHINEFLNETSYWVTWIANFGNWKTEIDRINNPCFYSSLQLSQIDWTYQIVNRKKCKIYFGDYFKTEGIKSKGGYNIYRVFISNYYKILRIHSLSFYSIEKDKFRLLKHFISPWNIDLIRNKELTFDTNEKWSILLDEYGYNLIFYLYVIYWSLIELKYKFSRLIKKYLLKEK